MSKNSAKAHLDPEEGESGSGYLSPSDIKDSLDVVYQDMLAYINEDPAGVVDAVTDFQDSLDLKADIADPTFTGTVVLPSTTSIGTVSNTEIGYLDGVTSAIQTQIDGKASTGHTHSYGTYSDWTPALTSSGTAPTNWAGSGRYTQLGNHVSGWGLMDAQTSVTAGTGTYYLSLPVAPKSSTGLYERIGYGEVYNGTNAWYFQMEKISGASTVQLLITTSGAAPSIFAGATIGSPSTSGFIAFHFDYEAA